MPRICRGLTENYIYHIINRGNNRNQVFHKPEDYLSFVTLIAKAIELHPIKLFCYCLMPNHFHLLAAASPAENISRWMQWLMTSHVRRYHAHYGSLGHIWQGRFKSFITKADSHLLTVARYVEGNSVRAGLVKTAADWPWSSHGETTGLKARVLTSVLPLDLPSEWTQYVDTPVSEREMEKIRRSVSRQMPYGDSEWQERVSRECHLESTMRPIGRPWKIHAD